MAIAAVVTIGFLIMLGLVLFIADRRRPAIFRLSAKVTRWVSLDLEMRSPEDGDKAVSGISESTHSKCDDCQEHKYGR